MIAIATIIRSDRRADLRLHLSTLPTPPPPPPRPIGLWLSSTGLLEYNDYSRILKLDDLRHS